MLGECYYRGHGVTEDSEQAVYWFGKAAESGHVVAQYKLGKCYESGLGVAKDYMQAEKWYVKAQENGYACKSDLKRVRSAITRSRNNQAAK